MSDPGTRNVMGGYVAGHAVQAGVIHGGVHVHEAPTARLPVPRQLPPPLARLVGRERELDEIERLAGVSRTGPAVVVLSGDGGVGKSALALAWAHRAGGRYPDGHLHTSLGGAEPAELLAQMLRALGVAADNLPAGAAERSALFRSLAAGKRLLILLDDAISAVQVRPLLPASPSTVVLVTARSRLGGLLGDGAALLLVEPLDDTSALALLAGVIGHERVAHDPAATSALLRRCAGLPHTLAMTADRLAARPDWPVGRIVEELVDDPIELLKATSTDRSTITMTAVNSTNVYQAAGDQYFIG